MQTLSETEIINKIKNYPSWKLEKTSAPVKLVSLFSFKNFEEALKFTNKVGAISEELNHHPDIYLAWGKVELSIFTHSHQGITNLDIEFVIKVSEIY